MSKRNRGRTAMAIADHRAGFSSLAASAVSSFRIRSYCPFMHDPMARKQITNKAPLLSQSVSESTGLSTHHSWI